MTARRSAVVLAGGRSRRMGREKALLELGGSTLLERALDTLAGAFDRLYLSVGKAGPSEGLLAAVDRFQVAAGRQVALVEDRLENVGPVAGVHAALEALEDDRAFFVAVDLPRIVLPLVDALWDEAARDGCIGCMPSIRERLEPAFAVYTTAVATRIPELVEGGGLPLRELSRLSGFRVIDLDAPRWRRRILKGGVDVVSGASGLQWLFRNINTPDEYRAWLTEGSRRG